MMCDPQPTVLPDVSNPSDIFVLLVIVALEMDDFAAAFAAVLAEQDDTFSAEVHLVAMKENRFFVVDLQKGAVGTAINQYKFATPVFDAGMGA